jgi:hypothetical protein
MQRALKPQHRSHMTTAGKRMEQKTKRTNLSGGSHLQGEGVCILSPSCKGSGGGGGVRRMGKGESKPWDPSCPGGFTSRARGSSPCPQTTKVPETKGKSFILKGGTIAHATITVQIKGTKENKTNHARQNCLPY